MKKFLLLLAITAMLVTGCGSNSQNATVKNESDNQSATAPINTAPINEEDSLIIKQLTNAYSIDGFDKPIVSFDADTNTYVVISHSTIKYSEIVTSNEKTWNSIISMFSDLTKSALNMVRLNNNEVNLKSILTVESCYPLVAVLNENVVFNERNTNNNEMILMTLESSSYSSGSKNVSVNYDNTSNTYTLAIYEPLIDSVNSTNWKTMSSLISDTAKSICDMTKIFDNTANTTVIFNDKNNNMLVTTKNGEIIESIFES